MAPFFTRAEPSGELEDSFFFFMSKMFIGEFCDACLQFSLKQMKIKKQSDVFFL